MSGRDGPIVVIGGGVIGALCAWHLAQAGRAVVVVDQGRFGAGCSHGNCGFVCPSHVLPLTMPGAVRRGIAALLHPGGALSIKPRLSPALWHWLWKFARRCNRRDMLRAAHARHELLQSSLRLYGELITQQQIDCQWEARGLLFVFASGHEFEAYAQTDRLLRETFGIAAAPYDGRQLVELEPALKPGLGGGWHYTGDCHLRPDLLMAELRRCLAARDVQIVEHFTVRDLRREAGRARAVLGPQGAVDGAQFVVAAGALAPLLSGPLGCRLPIQPGKGYSITMPRPRRCPTIPLIFDEHRVAVTPLRSGYRIGSTMELAGYDASINRPRLELLRRGAACYLHEPYGEPVLEEWFGWRPMTWDDMPIIDRSPALENVWIAAGHGMLGLSMAPATGKLLAELLCGHAPHIDPAPFRLAR